MWVKECFQSLFDLPRTWAINFFLIQVRNSEIATNSTGQTTHQNHNSDFLQNTKGIQPSQDGQSALLGLN